MAGKKKEKNTEKKKVVVLLSGGLDSAVALAWAVRYHNVVMTLTFDYNQIARKKELEAASSMAAHYSLRHEIIKLPFYSSLEAGRLVVPKKSRQAAAGNHAIRSRSCQLDSRTPTEKVWVPNRNAVFISIAAACAEAAGCAAVVCGFNRTEGEEFPDNTAAFVERMNALLEFSTLAGVRLLAPLVHMTKSELLKKGIELEAPLSLIHSCYRAREYHCGSCPSCRLLFEAARSLGAEFLIEMLFGRQKCL